MLTCESSDAPSWRATTTKMLQNCHRPKSTSKVARSQTSGPVIQRSLIQGAKARIPPLFRLGYIADHLPPTSSGNKQFTGDLGKPAPHGIDKNGVGIFNRSP